MSCDCWWSDVVPHGEAMVDGFVSIDGLLVNVDGWVMARSSLAVYEQLGHTSTVSSPTRKGDFK